MAEDLGRSETFKTSQMSKVATRKEALTAAADEGLDGIGALRAMLAQNWMRVVDLLQDWDEDSNGTVSLKEFSKALPVLGLKFSAETVETLFAEFDADGSGEVDMKELNRKLRPGAAIELDAELQDGAMGEIVVGAANAIALRKSADSGALNVQLDAESDVPLVEQLAEALTANLGRVIEVFRAWDGDGSGMISKREFRQGLSMLGLKEVAREQVDSLFDQIDTDHSGEIEYSEINKKLRRRIDPEEIRKRRSSFLKKERTASQGDSSTTRSNRTRKAARAEAYLALKAQEAIVMHRLVSVQRELLRSQSESSIVETRLRKMQTVQDMKAEMDERIGKDITARFASLDAATPEEVRPAEQPPPPARRPPARPHPPPFAPPPLLPLPPRGPLGHGAGALHLGAIQPEAKRLSGLAARPEAHPRAAVVCALQVHGRRWLWADLVPGAQAQRA